MVGWEVGWQAEWTGQGKSSHKPQGGQKSDPEPCIEHGAEYLSDRNRTSDPQISATYRD